MRCPVKHKLRARSRQELSWARQRWKSPTLWKFHSDIKRKPYRFGGRSSLLYKGISFSSVLQDQYVFSCAGALAYPRPSDPELFVRLTRYREAVSRFRDEGSTPFRSRHPAIAQS